MNKREKEIQQVHLNNEKAVLKKLEGNYKDALGEINSKIEILLARQDADMQHVIYQVEYQKALKTQVQSILETLQANEFETLSEYLTKSYEDGFIGTMYNLQGQGIPLVFPLDQEQIVAAIQHETKLSSNLYTALGLDVKELNKKIAGEISRGIATGAMYAEIARNVAGYARIPRNNAMRIARTEAHRIQTKASMNACEKAKSKGADVVKQWDSSLDKRTRDSHRDVDGEIKELEEKFSNGLMYPGDPSGRPEEVINCRCALLQRARWALGNSYTKWSEDAPIVIDDDGTTQFTIIEAKNYEDFQKKYHKAVEKMGESGKISVKKNYDSDLAKKFGKEHYDGMHNLIDSCDNKELKLVWEKYEQEIGVGDASYSGHEHYKPSTKKIYLNGARDAKGSNWQSPYQVTFHESGHNIDFVANAKAGGYSFQAFSYTYEDNKFGKTIKAEVDSLVNKYDAELKAAFKQHKDDFEWLHNNGFISNWEYNFHKDYGTWPSGKPKYAKSYAYKALEKEIRLLDSMSRADLSDILEGATKGKVKCGFGHGNSYWKDESSLPVEAFAEMLDSEMANPQSLETIKKYLPESYKVFCEMLSIMKGL